MTGGTPSAESAAHIARRALIAQLGEIIEGLSGGRRSDTAVHSIRKELKRARAAVRMLRECTGVVAYRSDNALMRDAARPLTPIRDSKVLLQTLEQIATEKTAVRGGYLRGLRKLLEEKRRLARRQLRAVNLSAAARVLRGVRRRAAGLADSRLAAAHSGGLKRAFKKARSAFAVARRQRTDESLHEWRKQTKYFASQLEMLLRVGPRLFHKSFGRAAQLADCLGDDHDLAMLTQQISMHAASGGLTANARRLIVAAKRRRKKLQRRALRLGHRLYSGRANRYRP